MDYTDIDFEILDFINKNQSASLEKIALIYDDFSLAEYRLKLLCKNTKGHPAVLNEDFTTEGRGQYSNRIYLGEYRLSDHGKKLLQDYKHQKNIHKRELWLKNMWIPIIVSFATTLLTSYLIPKLIHLLRW